jgi:hypothetical protein
MKVFEVFFDDCIVVLERILEEFFDFVFDKTAIAWNASLRVYFSAKDYLAKKMESCTPTDEGESYTPTDEGESCTPTDKGESCTPTDDDDNTDGRVGVYDCGDDDDGFMLI